MQITKSQLSRLDTIVSIFSPYIRIPKANQWKKMNDDQIWLRFVSQVVVVGGAKAAGKLIEQQDILGWSALSRIKTGQEIAKQISRGLLAIGTRYASKNFAECKKTKALIHNYSVIKKAGGPKAILKIIASLKTEEDRIKYLIKQFEYMNSKGARDFLTSGFGLAENKIALDVRVLGLLKYIGLKELPDKTPSSAKEYDAIEKEIVEKICRPLKIKPAIFDQILFKCNGCIQALGL